MASTVIVLRLSTTSILDLRTFHKDKDGKIICLTLFTINQLHTKESNTGLLTLSSTPKEWYHV